MNAEEQLIASRLAYICKQRDLKITEGAFNLLVQFVKFHFRAFMEINDNLKSHATSKIDTFEVQLARFLQAFNVSQGALLKMNNYFLFDEAQLGAELLPKSTITETHVQFDDALLKLDQ